MPNTHLRAIFVASALDDRRSTANIAKLPGLLKVSEEQDPRRWVGYAGAVNQRRQGIPGGISRLRGASHRIKDPKSGLGSLLRAALIAFPGPGPGFRHLTEANCVA